MRIIFILLFFSCGLLHAQKDSVLYNGDFRFKEGIYLNYESFRFNKPILKSAIVSDFDRSEIDFIRKMASTRIISYKDSLGIVREIATEKLWGFSENNSVYIRFSGDFNKIMVVGSLCHFTAMYTTYLSTGPVTGSGQTVGNPVESMQQYVLDIQTGMIQDFVLPNMETIYSRDPELYKEFMALKKGKRKQMMFIYLRKFNDRHPLYFLK